MPAEDSLDGQGGGSLCDSLRHHASRYCYLVTTFSYLRFNRSGMKFHSVKSENRLSLMVRIGVASCVVKARFDLDAACGLCCFSLIIPTDKCSCMLMPKQ